MTTSKVDDQLDPETALTIIAKIRQAQQVLRPLADFADSVGWPSLNARIALDGLDEATRAIATAGHRRADG